MTPIGDPLNVVRVWPVPDQEPVDTAVLSPAVRSAWVTDADVKELADG